jgi:hypothetical protein
MANDGVSTSEEPSRRVVDQRIRNRVIDYLELVASFADQVEYARTVPFVHVPYEVINQWEDWVITDPSRDSEISDVFTADEVATLGRFHETWEATVDAVPDEYPSLAVVQVLPEWERLRRDAESALTVLMRRGKMPEDHEDR